MDFIVQGFFQSIRLIISMDEETLNVVMTTLSLTGLSMLFILGIGLPLGFALGYFDFRESTSSGPWQIPFLPSLP